MEKRKPGRPGRLTEEHINWAYEKFLDGYPLLRIANILGVRRNNLQAMLFKRGMKKILPPLLLPQNLKETLK